MFASECSRDDAGFNLNPASPNLNAVPGDPDTLERVSHTQTVDVESDLTRGVVDPMVDTRTHLEGAVVEILVDTDDNWLVDDGFIKEGRDPHVELQEPGISRLATPEEAESLTLLSSPPPITPEAARTQRLAAVSTGMPANLQPEDGADLELPHDTLQPNEAREAGA
jgi:hypothetical protein